MDVKPAFAEFPLLGLGYGYYPQPGAGMCFGRLAQLSRCRSTTGGVEEYRTSIGLVLLSEEGENHHMAPVVDFHGTSWRTVPVETPTTPSSPLGWTIAARLRPSAASLTAFWKAKGA